MPKPRSLVNRAEERRWGRQPRLRHGKFLRAARERTGKTAKEICRETGISVGQLSDVERGIGPLSLKRARQLSKVLRGQSFVAIVQAILQDKVEDAGFNFEVVVGMPGQLNVVAGGKHVDGNEDPGSNAQVSSLGARAVAR